VTVFPGWRELAAVMRWARANGAVPARKRFGRSHVFPDGSRHIYICHRWQLGDARVVVGSYMGRTDPDMSIVNGQLRRDLYPESAVEALTVLAELDIVPFCFAHAAIRAAEVAR
jgi:hypothetical protein